MVKTIVRICILGFAFVGLANVDANAQSSKTSAKKTTKSVVKVDQMDVIYDEDDDYVGISFEQLDYDDETPAAESRQGIVLPPPPMEGVPSYTDNPDLPLPAFQSVDDEGAESEDEILYASFDSETIHYPKLDVGSMEQAVLIQLTDVSKDEGFSYPTPITSRPTSHFGPRRRRFHYGLDLAAPTGTPIYSMFNGTVRISKYNKSYGNLVVVRHDNGLETYYAHLSSRKVQPGDKVKAGEVIGLCGNTGRSYGSHLHLEIRYMGNAMNPENVIDCASHDLIDNTLTLTKNSFRKVAKKSANGNANRQAPAVASSKGSQYYRVRGGDTLSKIAQRNGTTIAKLCQLNGIKRESVLQIGQRLRLK